MYTLMSRMAWKKIQIDKRRSYVYSGGQSMQVRVLQNRIKDFFAPQHFQAARGTHCTRLGYHKVFQKKLFNSFTNLQHIWNFWAMLVFVGLYGPFVPLRPWMNLLSKNQPLLIKRSSTIDLFPKKIHQSESLWLFSTGIP